MEKSTVNENEGEWPQRGTKCEIKMMQARTKDDGFRKVVDVGSLEEPRAPSGEEFAVVVTRNLDDKKRLESTTLGVNSSYILEALQGVVQSHPSVASNFSEPFAMESPFQMLYHYWESLESYKDNLPDDHARMHIALLLEFMRLEHADDKKQHDAFKQTRLIGFSHLWIVYRPGEIAITFIKDHPWLLKIAKTAYVTENHRRCFRIFCTYSDYDGTNYGETETVFTLFQDEHFAQDHPANIVDLPVFPRKYVQDDETLEERLYSRGSQFLSLSGISIHHYKGMAEYLQEPPFHYFDPNLDDSRRVWKMFTDSGRIVVDPLTFYEDHYRKKVSETSSKCLDRMLCPPFVLGYSCTRKEWCRFFLPNLSEIVWQHDAFDQLFIPKKPKSLLQALLNGHEWPGDPRDPVQQKGKGLVCLLSGPPGSGKTLTAEYAAEITEKALINISAFELDEGWGPSSFERRLSHFLRLATTWQAVVLLDDADVFLEARDSTAESSAKRNRLVTLFLHHLEYFSGIVFLTTNRSFVFDDAIKSRIHVAIEYSAPGPEPRKQIWETSLLRLPEEERDLDIEAVQDELATAHLNGREIANVVNTARSLARYNSVPLTLSHIRDVLAVRDEFEASLQNTTG